MAKDELPRSAPMRAHKDQQALKDRATDDNRPPVRRFKTDPNLFELADLDGTWLDNPTEWEKREHAHMTRIGDPSCHGVLPERAASSAIWEAHAAADSDEIREQHNKTLNAKMEVLNTYAAHRRLDRDRAVIATRDAIASATGTVVKLGKQDMDEDRRTRLRMYFNGIAYAETLADEAQQNEIAQLLEIENYLLQVHRFDVRATHGRHAKVIAFNEMLAGL